MNKQNKQVPLLTAEMAGMLTMRRAGTYVKMPHYNAALAAIADSDAATYNTHTYEVVPKGMREAVNGVLSEITEKAESGWPVDAIELEEWAADLQRALNGE